VDRVRVIGCGNPDAGDDAVGLLAVREARGSLPRGVDVVEAGLALRILDLLDGVDAVVVVDAVRGSFDRKPGALIRAEGGPDGLPAEIRSSVSSHGLGIPEAVALAGEVMPLPAVVFLGLEASDLEIGHALSPAVRAALPGLVEAIVAEVEELTGW
jgi:hydrogenase maturation protease